MPRLHWLVPCLALALCAPDASGRDAETVEAARAALAAAEAERGSRPLAEADALEALAAALLREQQRAEVDALLQRALLVREREQGARHPDLAATLRRLGNERRAQRHYREAEALYGRAVAILDEASGEHRADLAATLFDLGTARHFDRRPEEAIEPLERAAALQAEDRPTWTYALPRTLERLASAHLARGAPASAVAVLEPWLPRLAAETGETMGIVEVLAMLGRAYRELGRSDEADALFDRRFAIFLARLGPQDALVGGELRQEAIQALMDGRMARAETLYRQRLALLEATPGVPPMELAHALRAIGEAIEPGERDAEADGLLGQALAIARESPRAAGPDLVRFLLAKGESSGRLGRFDEAIALHEEALALLASDAAAEPRSVAEAGQGLERLQHERRAARLGPQLPPERFLREGIVYESSAPVPARFDMVVTRIDRAHVEHEGRRIALWDLANHARDAGAASLLVRGMGDEDLCGGVLAIEHGVQVYFDYGDGTRAGLQFGFTEPDSVRRVWQMCRVRLAPDP